jgi:Ca-activated chloride channel family protein
MTLQKPKSKIQNGLLTLAGLSLLALGGPVVEKTEEGNRLYQAGQYEQAQTRYVEARSGVEEKTENSNRLHLNLGDALYQQKKYAEARKEFEQAAGSESVDLKARSAYNIGNTYFKEALQTQDQNQGLELLKQAVGSFRQTLELKPDDEDAKYNLEVVRRHLDVKQKEQQQQPQARPNPKPGDKNQQQQQDQKPQQAKGSQPQQQEQQQAQNQPQPQSGSTADKKEAAAKPEPQAGNSAEQKQAAAGEKKKPDDLSKQEAERLLDALQAQEEQAQKERYQAGGAVQGRSKDW